MDNNNLVAQAVRLALVAGMAGVVSVTPVYAQDDVAVQEPIVVTGSRIKRVEVEGPQPVTIINREEIDASGEISVSELLRTQTFNTFGSQKQQGGSEAGSQNTVSMRGLGPERTLVLINGRRMAGSPPYSGSAQSLSMIPLAAVERIEVLRDGASAIYGADALAGVINIILRSDYEGMNLGWYMARPSQSGGDEDVYTIAGGVSGAKGNVTFGFEANQKQNVYLRQRDFTSEGLSDFGFPSSYFAYLDTSDPRNPTGEFLSLGTFPDPRCPQNLNTDPQFPTSVLQPFGSADGQGSCRYNYAGVMSKEAENDTKNFFVDANYEINERTQFFTRGLFGYNEVESRLAADISIPLMSRNAPQNPTNPENPTNYLGDPFGGQSFDIDTDGDGEPDTTIEGPFDLSLLYRNVPGGTRDTTFDDTLLDYVAGVRGTVDRLGGADWEIAGQWSQQTVDETSAGQFLRPALQGAIDAGSYDIFGVFGPYSADEIAIAEDAAFTATFKSRTRIAGADGQLGFDAFQFDNGPVPVVLGFEYRDEDYETDVDEQSLAGGASQVSGARVVKSLFAETLIPMLPSLELNVALRYDDYNDFGTTVNPKISVAYRPMDNLLLRGSWGEGFQAPDMWELYAPSGINHEGTAIDSYRCSLTDADIDGDGRADVPGEDLPNAHPCNGVSFDESLGGDRSLDPERSENWSAGFAWSPTSDFSLIADYYDIKINDEIVGRGSQALLDDELRMRQAGATGSVVGQVTRAAGGRIAQVDARLENLDESETSGVDVEASYSFSVGRLGEFSSMLRWTHVFEFVQDWNNDQGSVDRAGDLWHPQDRAQLTINWSLGDFSATAVGNYISDQKGTDFRFMDPEEELDSFTTWDLQFAYATPWSGLVTIGARNVFDEDPPELETRGRYYDTGQHEVYGRVPYIRLEKDF